MLNYFSHMHRFSREIRLFLVTPALIGFTVFGGIYTVLFNLFLTRLGYGPEFIGLVNAASPLALAAFALPSSAIGSRIGARRAMVLGMSLAMVGHGLPILPNLFRQYGVKAGFWLHISVGGFAQRTSMNPLHPGTK